MTVFTGLKVESGTSTKMVLQSLIAPFHKPGNSSADGYGRVLIDGDDWKACAIDNEAIAKGTKVRVVKMESIIITVEKI